MDPDKKKIYIIGGIIGFLLLVIIIAVVISATGNKKTSTLPTGPVTLTFWNTFEDSQNLEPLFQAYTQQHPNVHIVYTKKNVETYETDLINALASGNGPDIFAINNSWLPKYLDKVVPATDSTITFNDYKNAFVDVVVSDFTKDRKIYGIPMAIDSLALYYNKDILGTAGIATPPKTWDELAQDVRQIKKQDSTGYFSRSGVAMGTNANVNRAVDILYLLMLQQGTVPYASDGSYPQFSQSVQKNGSNYSPSSEALSFYTSFANPYSPNYNWNSRSDYSIDSFANGRAAFLYSYSYTRQTLLQKSPNLNFDVTGVPQPNLDDPAVNYANYWGQVVSKQSKNSAVAWDFIKYLTSKAALDKYYSQNKLPSSRKDLISLQIQDPDIGVFANANLTAKSFYKPDQVKMDNIFGTMIDNIILKHLSVDTALSQASAQAATLTQRQ